MEKEDVLKDMSAVDIQQEYYETIGDADWELFEKKDRKYLLQKVAVALCGPPTTEGNLTDNVQGVDGQLKLQGYGTRDEETCMKVFNKIIEQAKYSYNGDNVIISILRVVCVIPSQEIPFYKITPKNYWTNLHVKKGKPVHILVFHVFSLRKCISLTSSVKGCRVFIDHDARVYDSWRNYLKNNQLPKCVMVVPENGEYRGVFTEGDEIPRVKLSVLASPELGPGAVVLNVTDKMSTAANVGALVTLVGSVFAAPALAPAMVTTAVGVGVVTGAYGIGRSISNLVDRAKHEQSIGFDSSEARSSWINILVSTVGLSFTAAGKLLSWAAASGRNIKILMNAVEFLKYSNLASGFVGVVHGLGDMIYKYAKYGEKPTKTEVFQFTTSLLFLGIGVMSNQTAEDIVKDAQANKINKIRDSLSSNNKRKIFDKVTAETRRLQGTIDGNTEVIRALNKIENKDEFFGQLKRINKSVNKNKVRISLNSDAKVLVNDQHGMSVSDMYKLGDEGRNKLFAKYGRAKVTSKNAPTRIYASYSVANSSNLNVRELACTIRPEEIAKISAFIIHLCKQDQDFIVELLSQISENIHDAFLLICAELISSLIPAELDWIESIFPDWKRRLILFVFKYLISKVTDDENDSQFVAILKKYIRDGKIHRETLLQLKDKLMEFFSKAKEDPKNKYFDPNYISGFDNSFKILRSGRIYKAGENKVIVTQSTVDYLEIRLQKYSQDKCDIFMDLCFKVISILSKNQIIRIIITNPDEDILMKVSQFLFVHFEKYVAGLTTMNWDVVRLVKLDLISWYCRQSVRCHTICTKCNGMKYILCIPV